MIKKILLSIALVLLIVVITVVVVFNNQIALALTFRTLMNYDDFDYELDINSNSEELQGFVANMGFFESISDKDLSMTLMGSNYNSRSCGELEIKDQTNEYLISYYLDDDRLKVFFKEKFPIGLHFDLTSTSEKDEPTENNFVLPKGDDLIISRYKDQESKEKVIDVKVSKKYLHTILDGSDDNRLLDMISLGISEYPLRIIFKKDDGEVKDIEVVVGDVESEYLTLDWTFSSYDHTRRFYTYNKFTLDAAYIFDKMMEK